MNKDKDRGDSKSRSSTSSSSTVPAQSSNVNVSFWVYNIQHNRWSCQYKHTDDMDDVRGIEPRPRYAHQLVFDEVNKVKLSLCCESISQQLKHFFS